MIHLGESSALRPAVVPDLDFRTLATDKGFKERVREDMLVRLLDAFVWRSHGTWFCFSIQILLQYPPRQIG